MDEDTLQDEEALKEDNFEDQAFLPNRHLVLKWGGVGVAVMALCVASWKLAEIPNNSASLTYAGARQPSTIAPRTPLALRESSQFDPSKAIGTTGSVATDAIDTEADASAIRELEAIMGGRSPSELVGQRVELQVPVPRENNLSTLWIGPPGDRVLVVQNRDVRDGLQRQISTPPAHGIMTVARGEHATISGTLQRVPSAEGRFSWGLTRPQLAMLQARGFYLLADSVRTE